MSIRNISGEDIHRITSGQVITDLATAVKELVENALDAHATQIECHFKNYGLDSLEVIDNGDGINEGDYDCIALKHYTSKLAQFHDLEKVDTLGFRGEALSSLCGIATMKIITTQKGPKATSLSFATSGVLDDKKVVVTRNKGTTVIITDLFKNLPVRKKDLIKNHKREFNRCLSLLQDYTLINTQVKFSIYNTTPKGKKTLVLSSQGSGHLKNNIISIYGSNGMYGLTAIDMTLDLNQYRSKLKMSNVHHDYKIRITGFISKTSFGYGRSATDRQVIYINKRPVELRSFTKMINEVYRGYNNVQYPVIIMDFVMDTQFLDVNVTPDKRTILIHNEVYVIEELRQALIGWFDDQDISIPRNMDGQRSLEMGREEKKLVVVKETETDGNVKLSKRALKFAYTETPLDQGDNDNEEKQQDQSDTSHTDDLNVELVEVEQDSKKRPSDTQLVEAAQKRVQEFLSEQELNELESIEPVSELIDSGNDDGDEEDEEDVEMENGCEELEMIEDLGETKKIDQPPSIIQAQTKNVKLLDLSQLSSFRNGAKPSRASTASASDGLQRPSSPGCGCDHDHEDEDGEDDNDEESEDDEVSDDDHKDMDRTIASTLRSTPQTDLESQLVNEKVVVEDDDDVQFMKVEVTKHKKNKDHAFYETKVDLPIKYAQFSNGLIELEEQDLKIDDINNQEESENYLTLTVSKSDFAKMKIIGQFNLGFILVIRDNNNEGKQDLFIVDQHASDEKYNFEDLQKHTVFDSQRLVIPQTLELNVLDELVVMDNQDVFVKNGFQLKIEEEDEPGQRIKLVSLPLSKRTVFDTSDFNELVHLIKENPGNTSSIRCSKIRSMFAMRACRKSIMIGKHLSSKTMSRVVKNLGTLDKPWNCPHGRPTMRHLIELQQWKPFNDDYSL